MKQGTTMTNTTSQPCLAGLCQHPPVAVVYGPMGGIVKERTVCAEHQRKLGHTYIRPAGAQLVPGTRLWHGPDGYGWVLVGEHNPRNGSVRVTPDGDPSAFRPTHTVSAVDLYATEQE